MTKNLHVPPHRAEKMAAEAGEQAGYQDYSTFSRAYKKHFGRGPSADVVRDSTICHKNGKNCDLL